MRSADMKRPGGRIPILGIETPFPLEELYVPVVGILLFFATAMVLGQLISRLLEQRRAAQQQQQQQQRSKQR